MIVRDAAEADIPAMADATARSYAHAFRDILGADTIAARDAAFFAVRFAGAWPQMRVAQEGDRILGISLVTDGHLDMLFLAPDVIGRGVGAALLYDAEARGAVTLECFRDNAGARRFYETRGWRLASSYEREFAGCQRAFVAYEKRPNRS